MSDYATAPAAERAMEWDDVIQYDPQKAFVLLPAGEYHFTVSSFERCRYEGSAKLPPCAMAKLGITLHGGERGDATVTHRLFLHTKTQGLLGDFLVSIGQARVGDKEIRPRWDALVGSTGHCRVKMREYTKKNGETGQANEIDRFLPPAEPTAAPASSWQQGAF